ncbi:universal stress protein [Paraburkholderia sp. LEh10]|uniref:universal stress protein n=1 Tax=Paraburkholderia sp. LEh10 TaxID=2821353 RepID=UPI003917BDF8
MNSLRAWRAIPRANARSSRCGRHKCDFIVMASHGLSWPPWVRALLPGSETQKVLTHSDIPALLVRSSVTV